MKARVKILASLIISDHFLLANISSIESMKLIFSIYFFVIILLVSCAPENPNKLKASQILKEINEISVEHRQNGKFEELISASKRFGEDRKHFPEKINQLREDAKFLKSYFENEIEKNNQVINKFNELLELNPVSSEAECIKHQINSLEKQTEKIKLSNTDFDLVLDEHIQDKETLDTKSQTVKNEIEKIDKEINLLDEQDKLKCSGKLK